jgi:hypothetical protein
MIQSVYTRYEMKNEFFGARLTRKNFKEIVEFVGRLADNVTVDHSAKTITFTNHWPHDKQSYTANIGDYIVRDLTMVTGRGDMHVYNKDKFKKRFVPKSQIGDLRWYNLTDVEYNVLRAILSEDSDCFYGYAYIMDYTKVDRATTKVAVDHLRQMGILQYEKGLMYDDGDELRFAGSGFGFYSELSKLLAEMLMRRKFDMANTFDYDWVPPKKEENNG